MVETFADVGRVTGGTRNKMAFLSDVRDVSQRRKSEIQYILTYLLTYLLTYSMEQSPS